MKKICYCADDYALNNEISHAVRLLLQQNSIQATSCLVQSPLWQAEANELLKLKNNTDSSFEVGLHLNFTHAFEQYPFHFPLSKLMLKTWTGQLERDKVRHSIEQQWQLFTDVMGVAPDFVDGHQHVHQFPIMREVLFDVLEHHQFKGWIRNLNSTIPATQYQFKTKALEHLGARTNFKMSEERHIQSNHFFAGIYDFKTEDYAELSQQWMKKAKDGMLIMCHPATELPEIFDEIQDARVQEFNYLSSKKFHQDCKKYDLQLHPMGAIL